MKRSAFLKAAFGGLCASAAGLPAARAQVADFPSRPVRLVSGFAPGGGTDILGRLSADLARWKRVTDRVSIQLN